MLNIIEEPSERASKPRLTENFIVNDEFSTRTFQTNFDSTDLSKVKKRNSILNQLNVAPSTTSSRKSLGPLLDMELSRHASFTGLAVPQSQIAPSTFKAQIQVQSTDLAIAQAKLFAEACAQAMAKADEIAQIEADAQLTYVPPDFHENIQQSLNIQRSRSTSKSKTKMENQRRLPVLPLQKPRKESQPMFSNRRLGKFYLNHVLEFVFPFIIIVLIIQSKSHEHRKVAFSLNQSAIEHQQQPTTTINSINSNKVEKKI